jgi:hypothetical protein
MRQARTPHLRYKEQWEKNKRRERDLGPGRYNIKHFTEETLQKPSSRHGVCETRGPRMAPVNKFLDELPGPGSYGKGGIPSAAKEEKARKSAGIVGILSAGAQNERSPPTVGSSLAPGQYKKKAFTDELLQKRVSRRGPYDLFSGYRNRPVTTGHLSVRACHNIGPGQYYYSFTDELEDKHHVKHGRLGSLAQYPELPTERIYCDTLSQWPRPPEDPGPGSYSFRPWSAVRCRSPPFNSSEERWNQRTVEFFLGSQNHVGPGRYDIRRWEEAQDRNGCRSAFSSASVRMTKKGVSERDRLLQERVTPRYSQLYGLYGEPQDQPSIIPVAV